MEVVHTVDRAAKRFNGLFETNLALDDGRTIPSLPLALDAAFRHRGLRKAPALGATDPDAQDRWQAG